MEGLAWLVVWLRVFCGYSRLFGLSMERLHEVVYDQNRMNSTRFFVHTRVTPRPTDYRHQKCSSGFAAVPQRTPACYQNRLISHLLQAGRASLTA